MAPARPQRKFNLWTLGLIILILSPLLGTVVVGMLSASAKSSSQGDTMNQVAKSLQLRGAEKGMYYSTAIEKFGEPLATEEYKLSDNPTVYVTAIKYAWPNGNMAILKFSNRELIDGYEYNVTPPAMVPFDWTGKKAKYYREGTNIMMFDGDPPKR